MEQDYGPNIEVVDSATLLMTDVRKEGGLLAAHQRAVGILSQGRVQDTSRLHPNYILRPTREQSEDRV